MSSGYARFQCRICGELVYSPLTPEQNAEIASGEKVTELTCSGGHSDQYRLGELKLVETKPNGRLQMRRVAVAAGG